MSNYRNALSTGYSGTLFSNDNLRKAAQRVAGVLADLERQYGKFHVAVTGKSGIAMAFAVAMIYDVKIVTIRKTNETSHGGKIEGDGCLDRYVILDDFVDSGATVRQIVRDLEGWARSRDGHGAECLGFIEYCRFASDYNVRKVHLDDGRTIAGLAG